MSNPSNTYAAAAGSFVKESGRDYQSVAASATDTALGAKGGAAGDMLSAITAVVTLIATSNVSVKDGGGSSIPLVPVGATTGVYQVELHALSRGGAWSITTGAGVTAVATGFFT